MAYQASNPEKYKMSRGPGTVIPKLDFPMGMDMMSDTRDEIRMEATERSMRFFTRLYGHWEDGSWPYLELFLPK